MDPTSDGDCHRTDCMAWTVGHYKESSSGVSRVGTVTIEFCPSPVVRGNASVPKGGYNRTDSTGGI